MKDLEENYIVIKANESNVSIIGLTRGEETKSHHTEKLDKNEVMILQFTDKTSAVKIKGKASVFTKYGEIKAGE